jgi:hypothetical protein
MQQFLLMVMLVVLSACKKPLPSGQGLPVVGLDRNGNSDLTYIPKSTFHNKMSPLIYGISNQVINKLEHFETSENNPWTLSRVTIGLGIEAEFEVVEEVLEAEIESDIELRFQKI